MNVCFSFFSFAFILCLVVNIYSFQSFSFPKHVSLSKQFVGGRSTSLTKSDWAGLPALSYLPLFMNTPRLYYVSLAIRSDLPYIAQMGIEYSSPEVRQLSFSFCCLTVLLVTS
jgi:hypothetical protein